MARDDSPRRPYPEPIDDRVADFDAARARRPQTVGELLDKLDPSARFSERLPERLAQMPIHQPAIHRAKDLTNDYYMDLIIDAALKARRSRLDAVSEIHVIQAADDGASTPDAGWRQHLNSIGGVMLGIGVSVLLANLADPPAEGPNVGLVTAMLLMSLLGTYLIARSTRGWSLSALTRLFSRWRRNR